MPADHVFGDLEKTAIRTIGAFDSWFLTDASHPFIHASRRVTGLPGLSTLEPARIDVGPAAEQRQEQRDLGGRRGISRDCLASALPINTFGNGIARGHAGTIRSG